MEPGIQILIFFVALLGVVLVGVCVYCSVSQERRRRKSRKKRQIQKTVEEAGRHYDSNRIEGSYKINVDNIPNELRIPKIVPSYYSERIDNTPDEVIYRRTYEENYRPPSRPVKRYPTTPDFSRPKSRENINRNDGFYYHNKFYYSPQAPQGAPPVRSQSTHDLRNFEQYPSYYDQRHWKTYSSPAGWQDPYTGYGKKSQSTHDLTNRNQHPSRYGEQMGSQSFNERRSRSTNDLRHSHPSSNIREQQSSNAKRSSSRNVKEAWESIPPEMKKKAAKVAVNVLKNQLDGGGDDDNPIIKNLNRVRKSFKLFKKAKKVVDDLNDDD